ncbi:tRNA-splicing endonuclease subunit [Loxospora ochrophaea]|nr:tRNA-splicing endonuclease subunit [Loxospora ochrophaea]
MTASADLEISPPQLPFPIFYVSNSLQRYLLYDINVITWLRKTHHILGVLIGTLPQIPQQNVFLGLPLELMPEEVTLLLEKGVAYTVDDLQHHTTGLQATTQAQRESFKQSLRREGREAAKAAESKKRERTEKALGRIKFKDDASKEEGSQGDHPAENAAVDLEESEEQLFASPNQSSQSLRSQSATPSLDTLILPDLFYITPTTSHPPLPRPPNHQAPAPKFSPSSYALFKHLHDRGYYLSPGLRFGCQFLVYPGDPLRFHSHFLAISVDWDEEIDLLDLVGGGRLGTGVKKGWLIGGPESSKADDTQDVGDTGSGGALEGHFRSEASRVEVENSQKHGSPHSDEGVRVFCIEWGGM